MKNSEAAYILKNTAFLASSMEKVDEAVKLAVNALDGCRWVAVSEQLPEEETEVLVTVYFHGVKDYKGGWNSHIEPKYYTEVASFYDDEWHSYTDEYKIARNRHEVIAWMPLPEPYKEV